MAKRPQPLDRVTPELIDRAEDNVRRAGALAPTKLLDVPLSRAAQAHLADALGRRGLEQTGKSVRVPLVEQLSAALSRDAVVPVASLRRVLRGATGTAEIAHSIEETLRAGRAQLVLHAGKEHLALPTATTVAGDALDVLL